MLLECAVTLMKALLPQRIGAVLLMTCHHALAKQLKSSFLFPQECLGHLFCFRQADVFDFLLVGPCVCMRVCG